MENQVSVKRSANYAFKLVGTLMHDNLLFDRTCPACRKGMYSSREYTRCPKCGATLVYLTSESGQTVAISEGSIDPALSSDQKKKDAIRISKRKNGMPIKYRFKMYSQIDDHGILSPPPEHDRCRSGAKVEIQTMHHQFVPSYFMGKDPNNPNNGTKVPWVELLVEMTDPADYAKVLTAQEYASKTVSHKVNHDGSPAPIDSIDIANIDNEIAAIEKRIASIKAAQSSQTPAPQAPQASVLQPNPFGDESVPWEEQKAMSVGNDVDPFKYA